MKTKLNNKICHNHSLPLKIPGVRDILNRVAESPAVDRVIIGPVAYVPRSRSRADIRAGPDGSHYLLRINTWAIRFHVVPHRGRKDDAHLATIAATPR